MVLTLYYGVFSNSLLMPLELFYPSSGWSSGPSLLRKVKARCYGGPYRQLLTLLMSRCQLGYFQTFAVPPTLEGEGMIPFTIYVGGVLLLLGNGENGNSPLGEEGRMLQ